MVSSVWTFWALRAFLVFPTSLLWVDSSLLTSFVLVSTSTSSTLPLWLPFFAFPGFSTLDGFGISSLELLSFFLALLLRVLGGEEDGVSASASTSTFFLPRGI